MRLFLSCHPQLSVIPPRAQVYLAPHSAKVVLSGEYLEDHNLDSVARNIALSGLNVFPDSAYFGFRIDLAKEPRRITVTQTAGHSKGSKPRHKDEPTAEFPQYVNPRIARRRLFSYARLF